MPFIWDDAIYRVVDDKKEYDKKRFVIVRKLFVRPNTKWQKINDVQVSRSIFLMKRKKNSMH